MKILLSPSKTQDFSPITLSCKTSTPVFAQFTQQLVHNLKNLSITELSNLMSISSKLAELNYLRFQNFTTESKPALFAFEGDVYTDINVQNYSQKQLEFANNTVRILSGLYGILKPLDLIHPYRLEMKTKLKTDKAENLYQFWDSKITDFLNQEESEFIVNLASEEYFKVIQSKNLKAKLININFKEKRPNGKLQIIAIHAKRARGTMANFIIENQLNNPEQLKNFNLNNYSFQKSLSTENEFTFVR